MADRRPSLDLLQHVVRGRDQLGWTVQQTAEALDLTLWRVKDVLRRHDTGRPLCADGKHKKRDRATTHITAEAKEWLRKTLTHNPRMHSDELALRLHASLASRFANPPSVDAVNKAIRALGFTPKKATRVSVELREWERERYWRTVHFCLLPEQLIFTDETYLVRGA